MYVQIFGLKAAIATAEMWCLKQMNMCNNV
jgi:hypothetical protein